MLISQLFRMFYIRQYDHRMHQLQSEQSLASEGSHHTVYIVQFTCIQTHVRNRSLIFEPDLFR